MKKKLVRIAECPDGLQTHLDDVIDTAQRYLDDAQVAIDDGQDYDAGKSLIAAGNALDSMRAAVAELADVARTAQADSQHFQDSLREALIDLEYAQEDAATNFDAGYEDGFEKGQFETDAWYNGELERLGDEIRSIREALRAALNDDGEAAARLVRWAGAV